MRSHQVILFAIALTIPCLGAIIEAIVRSRRGIFTKWEQKRLCSTGVIILGMHLVVWLTSYQNYLPLVIAGGLCVLLWSNGWLFGRKPD